MVNRKESLTFGSFYHVYNRAVGDDLIFRERKNYRYFYELMQRFLYPFVDLYAYCLMPNHFHFLIRVKDRESIVVKSGMSRDEVTEKFIHQAFSNFFNSYSKSYNKIYKRKGKLFIQSYGRLLLTDDLHLRTVIKYIHRNPIHHKFTGTYPDWDYSSYREYQKGRKIRAEVSNGTRLFGSRKNFFRDHEEYLDLTGF